MNRLTSIRVGVLLAALLAGGGCRCSDPPTPSPSPSPSASAMAVTPGPSPAPTPTPAPPTPAPPRDYGLVFVDPEPHFEVERRYDQRLQIAVANEGSQPQPLRLALQNPHGFLQADFVGPGSRDSRESPPVVAPGETWTAVLVVHAPAAPPGEVSMAIQLLEDGPQGTPVTYRSARVRVTVALEEFDLGLQVGAADPLTLARRVTVHNRGATLEDLDLQLEGDLAGRVSIEPTVHHARLAQGATMEVTIRPGLLPGFEGIRGELVARTAAGEERVALAFEPPDGTRLYLARGGSVTTASSQTRYCTNRGYGSTPMGGPSQPGPGYSGGGSGSMELGPAWGTTGTGFEGGRDLGRYPPARRPPPEPSPEPRPEPTAEATPEPPSPPPGGVLDGAPGSSGRSVLAPPPPLEIPPLPPISPRELVRETPTPRRGRARPTIPVGILTRVRRAPLALGGARGVSAPLGVAPGDPGRPLVATSPHGTDLLWSEDDARAARSLVYSQLGPDGQGVRPPVRLTRPGSDAGQPALATAPSGRVLAAWVEGGRIHVRGSEDRGSTWSEARELRGFGGEVRGLEVGAAGGYQVVAWVEEGVEAHVFLARRPEGTRDFEVDRVPAPGPEVRSLGGLHLDAAGTPSLLVRTAEGSTLLRAGSEPERLPGTARLAGNHGEPGWLGREAGADFELRPLAGGESRAVARKVEGPATWALEVGADGPWVRLHPEEGGHWKLTPDEALRLPSRDAGAAAGMLAFEIRTPWDARTYRRHRLEVALNGEQVLSMDEVVPQGRFLVPVGPGQLRWDGRGRPENQVEVTSEKLNPGHYYNLEAFQLHVRSPAREDFVFAESQDAADEWISRQEGVNHGTPDLALGLATDFMLPARAPDRLELPLVVANRGDAGAKPTHVQVLADDVLVTDVPVPSLAPMELRTVRVPVPLPPETRGLEVRLEAPGSPEDDSMELFFTSPARPDPAAPARVPARRPPFPDLHTVTPGVRVAVRLPTPGARQAYRIPAAAAPTLSVELTDVPVALTPEVALYRPDGTRLEPGPEGAYPAPGEVLVAVVADVRPDAADPGEFFATFTWQEAP